MREAPGRPYGLGERGARCPTRTARRRRGPSGSSSSSPGRQRREGVPDGRPHDARPCRRCATSSWSEPDLLRALVEQTVNALLSGGGRRASAAPPTASARRERINQRNGYRERRWDTRAGTIDLQIPKLREGSYFPDWLLDRRRRAEKALISVVADLYLAGVSTRRVEKAIAAARASSAISKSQVSRLWRRARRARRGLPHAARWTARPYPFVMLDALVVKVREAGRIVNVCVVHATGVNRDGYRESLGLDIVTAEDGAAWLAFLRGLVARGLAGVQLVTSDAHPGLVDAIRSTLPGASWQRCRTHFMRNLLTRVPEDRRSAPSPRWCARSSTRPTPTTSHEQYDRVLAQLEERFPAAADAARGRRPRPARLHRLPAQRLAPDLEQQPDRTPQQGDPPPHRRRLDLPTCFDRRAWPSWWRSCPEAAGDSESFCRAARSDLVWGLSPWLLEGAR